MKCIELHIFCVYFKRDERVYVYAWRPHPFSPFLRSLVDLVFPLPDATFWGGV
jgi:hypothetical protein